MITFEVNDMTCGHCVGAITKAVMGTDKDAVVQIDLPLHLVQIEPGTSDAKMLQDAIREAGYTPVAASAPALPAKPSAQRGGCCCR